MLSRATQQRDLLAGAAALLAGTPTPQATSTARDTLLEARALASQSVDEIERFIAVEHEAQRNEHKQAAKHVGTEAR
jgi:hypothetical protein